MNAPSASTPVVGTKRPKVTKPKHQTWTAAQLHTSLEHAGGQRLAVLYTVAAATGMRRGGLCGLRWSDVDLDDALSRVAQSVTQVGQERRYSSRKDHERRTVNIDPATVAVLRSLRLEQSKARLAWGTGWQGGDDLVFGSENGAPGPARLRLQGLHPDRGRHRAAAAEAARAPAHPRDPAAARGRAGARRRQARGPQGPVRDADRLRGRHPDDDGRAVDVFSRAVYGA